MVVSRHWTPDRGDLIWLTFSPQMGREQAGRRPAFVLSPALYNGKTNLAVVCPITSQPKGYPFEVRVPAGGLVAGCVLTDHVKNVDWKARNAKLIERASAGLVAEVMNRIAPLLGF